MATSLTVTVTSSQLRSGLPLTLNFEAKTPGVYSYNIHFKVVEDDIAKSEPVIQSQTQYDSPTAYERWVAEEALKRRLGQENEAREQEDEDRPESNQALQSKTMILVHPACSKSPRLLVKSFSQESALDLDNFAVAPTLEECYTFMFAATLETRDLLKELVKNKATEGFEIKESLKKIITLHAKALVFSSTAMSYVGPDIPEKVLLAMHANKTSDLPPKQDIIGKDKVIKEINSALSDARHWMKARLLDTLKKTDPMTGNIGAVTSRILGSSGIPATLQLHMRVAVVRWHLVHFPSLLPKKFWPHVDDFLAQALEKGRENYTMVLNKMYKLDVAEYGAHDVVKFPVLDLLNASDRIDEWTATANTYFDKIRPQKLTDEERIAPTFDDGQGGGKRKRAEDDIGGRLEDGDE